VGNLIRGISESKSCNFENCNSNFLFGFYSFPFVTTNKSASRLCMSVDFMPIAIRYTFDQSFSIPAAKAFQWCTDYGMDDHKIMGEINAKRQVVHLTESTILLKDTFQFGKTKVEKKKLVELYPQNLFWTSTHLSGPNKHSQFLYQINQKMKLIPHSHLLVCILITMKKLMPKCWLKSCAKKMQMLGSCLQKLWKKTSKPKPSNRTAS